jgi:hypothetical protein
MKRIVPFLIAAAALGGCAAVESQLYSGYAARPLSEDGVLEPYAKLVGVIKKSDTNALGWVEAKCFNSPVNESDKPGCTVARNQTIAVLAIASGDLCVRHRQSIYGREASVNVALGTLTNLFAGGAAVARSEAAKSLYAALALFSNSERSLVNETVYKTMIVTAVDQKIVELMDTRGQALDQSQSKSIDEFGMQQALLQVIALHNSCSFMNGLRLALAEGTRGSNAKKLLALRQNLASIGNEMAQACGAPAPQAAKPAPATSAGATAGTSGGTPAAAPATGPTVASSATSGSPTATAGTTATGGSGTSASPAATGTAASVRCEAAKQRFQAVSTALQAVEIAVE